VSGRPRGGSARIVSAASWRALLAAMIAAPLVAAAQDDALEPFLGTWSGFFTTQDNDFWGLEDIPCFPGCGRDFRDRLVALVSDPKNDARPAGELLGEASAFYAQQMDSLLTPEGRLMRAANTPANDPKLHCEPYGFVREVTNPLPMVMQRDGDDLLVRYEEWSLLRTIYMTERAHPEHRVSTLLGHSIGRIENGTLVVETAQINPGWISDASLAAHSGALTAVERYTVLDDPRRLELTLTLTDPLVLTEPYIVVKTWIATPEVELLQDSCGELPGKF
jgi:hypothetical protein